MRNCLVSTAVCIAILFVTGCNDPVLSFSDEESQILTTAAPNDSMVVWTRFDGVLVVEIGGADLVPDQRPETTDAWLTAIESLEQQGFLSGDGLKAGCYVLTKRGHAAANEVQRAR